jgi:hypothetical protein
MNNLSSNKGGMVMDLIEDMGCKPLYLPPYSPDFKPDRDLPTTMRLQTQTVLSLAPKGCSDYWRW